jgi:hypothetical protein
LRLCLAALSLLALGVGWAPDLRAEQFVEVKVTMLDVARPGCDDWPNGGPELYFNVTIDGVKLSNRGEGEWSRRTEELSVYELSVPLRRGWKAADILEQKTTAPKNQKPFLMNSLRGACAGKRSLIIQKSGEHIEAASKSR